MKDLATPEMIDEIFEEMQKGNGSISSIFTNISNVKKLINGYLNEAYQKGADNEKNKKIKNQQRLN